MKHIWSRFSLYLIIISAFKAVEVLDLGL